MQRSPPQKKDAMVTRVMRVKVSRADSQTFLRTCTTDAWLATIHSLAKAWLW